MNKIVNEENVVVEDHYVVVGLSGDLPEYVAEMIKYQLCRYEWNTETNCWDWDNVKEFTYRNLTNEERHAYFAEVARLLQVEEKVVRTFYMNMESYELHPDQDAIVCYSIEYPEVADTDTLINGFKGSIFGDEVPTSEANENILAMVFDYPFYGSVEEQLANLLATLTEQMF